MILPVDGKALTDRLEELAGRPVPAHAFDVADAELLDALLTEQEQAVYRRGRNGGAHPPKNADPGHYAKATGLEALFGYLYLNGAQERARELFEAITANKESAKQN